MIAPEVREALQRAVGDSVEFDADTSRLTSLRVGGPADALATPEDRPALARLLATCHAHRLRQRVIGRGFNMLIRDEGFDGVLIRLSRFRALEERPGPRIFAEAGVSHASLTRFCRDRGLSGLEYGAGIPGSLGGWIAMNAGIGPRETRDIVEEIEVIGPLGDEPRQIPRDALQFEYRALRGLEAGTVVVSALLEVKTATPDEVGAEVERLLAHRAATQPLDIPSCGSVFKNPPGGFAGQLIEAAGLKGSQRGGVMISPVHANFIVNTRVGSGACADDVLTLIERARTEVERSSGIRLETEVQILGRTHS
ncbi:MAG: UDP-N-acetylmuramate dehydrogenase [Deltaproteobacteria bacterium]|nr:UDP-N-acetylmuramate dehydrogenase [Deltaproteobacteria bacterium]MBW2361461.1 UDP-N-acetylmuramate dehydrogenase [Deltaproteobacteria bacterium]